MNVLVLDDETEIADLVEVYLKNEDYNVFKCYKPEDALKIIETEELSLAILDIMLENISGFEILKRIRESGLTFPVIMLTAKIEDQDKINGLTLGADDYITKPFNPLELIARVKAALRRYTKYDKISPSNEIVINGLSICEDTHICTLYDKEVDFTPIEFDIVLYLAKNINKVVSSEELFEAVWKDKYLDSNNTVMVHIRRIREKLNDDSKNPKYIKTIWEWGIKLKTAEINKLKRNIALKTSLKIIVISLFVMIFLLFLVDGVFNDDIANLLLYFDGVLWYWLMHYKVIVMALVFSLVITIVSYFVIKKNNNYLPEIVDCINKILKNSDQDIHLSSDLSIIENDLNKIRIDLIQSKARAQDEENKKNDLIMYMAHDLKTPLTSVIGYLSLLVDEKEISKKQQDKYLSIALEKAYRVEELTNEFFEITRYNLHEMVISKNNIDLSILFNQLIDESYPMLQDKKLKISIEKPNTLIMSADGTLLARAFSNLIKNAINYSYTNSTISIFVKNAKDKVKIEFRNKGDKIPSYKIDRLFEKFYRGDSSRKSATGGSGLGLSITKEIIELHNGTISAENNDEYIKFKITLPK